MKKRYINYLIKKLRCNRSMMRALLKKFSKTDKSVSGIRKEYKLQLEIIRALQVLKVKQ